MDRRSKLLFASAGALAVIAGSGWWLGSRPRSPSSASALAPVDRQEQRPSQAARDARELAREAGTDGTGRTALAGEARSSARGRKGRDGSEGERRWVEGRVVLRPGAPADERVFVLARRISSGLGEREAGPVPVGADGRFRLELASAARRAELHLDARYHFLREALEIALSESREEIVLEPELGAVVRCTLVTARGPIEGREATAFLFTGSAFFTRARSFDPTAGFELEGVPAGTPLVLCIDVPRYSRAERKLELRPGEVAELEIELPLGVTLAGRVVGPQGDGLSGAFVYCLQLRDESIPEAVPSESSRSDEAGRFRMEGIPAGELRLYAQHPDCRPGDLELGRLSPGAQREDLVLRLERAQVLAGRVRWPDGRPASGARVRVLPVGGTSSERSVETDGQGEFAASELDAGLFTVCAEAEAQAQASDPAFPQREQGAVWRAVCEDVTPGAWKPELVLGPGERLAGRVVDQTGRPVTRFRVIAVPERRERGDPLVPKVVCTFQNEHGEFVLDELWRGSFDVELRANGHADAEARGVLVPRAGEPLLFTLPRLATLSGRVCDADGAPIEGARVTARPVEANGARRGFARTIRTERAGAFAGLSIDPGPVRVFAAREGYARSEEQELALEPGEESGGLRLALRRAGTITVELGPLFTDRQGDIVTLSGPAPEDSTLSGLATDADGIAVFTDLASGTYRVSLSSTHEVQVEGREYAFAERERATPPSERVPLGEGEHARVVLTPGPVGPR